MTINGEKTQKPSWLGRVFRQRLAEQATLRRERFEQVMALAKEVAADDPLGLPSMARLIAAPLQARAITSAALNGRGARATYGLSDLFGSPFAIVTSAGETVDDVVGRSRPERYRLRLGRDPILAVPWMRSRLVSAIANIGHSHRMGAWRADSNHKVQLVLPFGVAVVHGGNHSLAAGIANAEGSVVTRMVSDLSPLYAHLHYDGLSMVRIHDGCSLWDVVDEELGMLFEIGRLMLEHGVRYDAPIIEGDECDDDDDEGERFPICYRVFFNGTDTGYSLSDSGVTRALLQAGIAPSSAEAKSIVVEGAEFVHRNRAGRPIRVVLKHYGRRPLVNDLERVAFFFYGGDD